MKRNKTLNLKSKKLLLTFCASTALLTVSYAKPAGKRQPPQEAIDACVNLDSGTQCKVVTRRGDTLQGTCVNTPDGKYFVCMPKDRKRKEEADKR